MTEESTLPIANSQGHYTTALEPDDKDELEGILDGLGSQGGENIPCWEFCDGFLTALVCCRRLIPPAEYLPVLLGDGGARLEGAAGESLPRMPVFADAAQQTRFMQLWTRRWNEVVSQLDISLETMVDEYNFQPGVLDMRGAMAELTDEERAEMGEDYVTPPLGMLWAQGFLFAVKNWIDDWEIPDDREATQWQDRALDEIAGLLEDDTGVPEVGAIEDGPPSISRARVAVFCKAARAARTRCASSARSWARAWRSRKRFSSPVGTTHVPAAAARSTRSATADVLPPKWPAPSPCKRGAVAFYLK